MKPNRRFFIASGLANISVLGPYAFAQNVGVDEETIDLPRFPASLASLNGLPELVPNASGFTQFGSAKPPQLDFDVAKRLVELAPHNCPPIEVAQYFNGIREGAIPDLGSDALNVRAGRHFACGWPVFYNPVVVEFFRATSLNPLAANQNGDATHWCAAFVNWCVARGRAKSAEAKKYSSAELADGTKSASSGSFRCWGKAAEAPQYGDIVVFARRGSVTGSCPNLGQGHVGFFAGMDGERILVLGGNQSNPTTVEGARNSAVSLRRFRRSYATVRSNPNGTTSSISQDLHSFRTAEFLRG